MKVWDGFRGGGVCALGTEAAKDATPFTALSARVEVRVEEGEKEGRDQMVRMRALGERRTTCDQREEEGMSDDGKDKTNRVGVF